jgi:hypothetical protein
MNIEAIEVKLCGKNAFGGAEVSELKQVFTSLNSSIY